MYLKLGLGQVTLLDALGGDPAAWPCRVFPHSGGKGQALDSPGLELHLTLGLGPSPYPLYSGQRVKVYKHEEPFDQNQTPRVLTVFCSKLQARTRSHFASSREDCG